MDELQERLLLLQASIHYEQDEVQQARNILDHKAFAAPEEGVTKVIAATNAAESSVTLPDVSLVVCLGGQKVVVCDERGTTRLMKTWISKASATQRAGRTARVAPGVVVRLYPKEALDQLPDHDAAEITRQPLEDTLLNLRAMLPEEEGLGDLLDEALEPPAPSEVERALQSLMQMEMLAPTHDLHMAPREGKCKACRTLLCGTTRRAGSGSGALARRSGLERQRRHTSAAGRGVAVETDTWFVTLRGV